MIEYVKQRKSVSYIDIIATFKIPSTTARRRLQNICKALGRKYEKGVCIDTSQA